MDLRRTGLRDAPNDVRVFFFFAINVHGAHVTLGILDQIGGTYTLFQSKIAKWKKVRIISEDDGDDDDDCDDDEFVRPLGDLKSVILLLSSQMNSEVEAVARQIGNGMQDQQQFWTSNSTLSGTVRKTVPVPGTNAAF